ncbi:hypothetical protein ACIQXR_04695 [Peribacillus sp. NPDC097224]|uniref:hypothetical protein n=1 Tax=Peribacillus sp. NPDC097224 TaxID=3364399 RepID=UPI003826BE79
MRKGFEQDKNNEITKLAEEILCFDNLEMEQKELLEFLKHIKISNKELKDRMDKIESLMKAKQQNPSPGNNGDIVRKGIKFNSGLILPEIGISHTTRALFNENNKIIEKSKRKRTSCFL